MNMRNIYNPIFTLVLMILCGLAPMASATSLLGGEQPMEAVAPISKYVQKKYYKDAVRLALRLNAENKNFHALDVDASEGLVESIYSSLLAIHESKVTGAEEVTKLHKVHTFPTPSVDRFFIVYEKKASWAKPLRMGDNKTGSEKINKLLEKYGLVIDRNSEWDEEHNSIHVRATEPLNIAPLANDFKKIDGVVLVDLLQPDGDGNDIEIKSTGDGWQIDFVLKFGSCIDGCNQRHFWSFEVNNDGDVIFLGEFGDELPEWMREDRQLAERF
ncbi:MAG: hypothetical protein AAFW73_13040 [Bacteroidota bacterium]